MIRPFVLALICAALAAAPAALAQDVQQPPKQLWDEFPLEATPSPSAVPQATPRARVVEVREPDGMSPPALVALLLAAAGVGALAARTASRRLRAAREPVASRAVATEPDRASPDKPAAKPKRAAPKPSRRAGGSQPNGAQPQRRAAKRDTNAEQGRRDREEATPNAKQQREDATPPAARPKRRAANRAPDAERAKRRRASAVPKSAPPAQDEHPATQPPEPRAAEPAPPRPELEDATPPAPVPRERPAPTPQPPPAPSAPPPRLVPAAPAGFDTCRIRLHNRPIKAHFFAVPYDGGPVLARSPYFKIRRAEDDPGLSAPEALRTLVDQLTAAGWRQTGAGRAPWDLRFERGAPAREPAAPRR